VFGCKIEYEEVNLRKKGVNVMLFKEKDNKKGNDLRLNFMKINESLLSLFKDKFKVLVLE